jgi:hypothetical protein
MGSFTVTGLLPGGKPYDVTVDGDEPLRGAWGIVAGSSGALSLLSGLEGQVVAPGRQGPFLTVAPTDGKSILAALIANTTVTKVAGVVPSFGDAAPVPAG